MKIPGVPATTIKVYIDYYNSGDPEWSTRNDNHTSANFIWTSNGSDATNFNVLRDILNVDYRFAAVTPIGNIGQMEKSSNEFVYIRGGAIYNFEIEHGVVPVLHTSPFTVLGQTINLLVAVSAPNSTDVTKTEYDSKMVQLDDQIRQTVTKTEFSASNEELKKQIGNVVTKYDQISGKVETVDNRLGTIEKSGYIVKDKFVDIFSSFKNQLGESIISSISLSPGTARIAADKIEISGATIFKDDGGNIVNIFGTGGDVFSINNGVFKVDKNGKLTATNAVIKGTIEATSGKIGGFTIGAINLKNGELELSQDKIVYNDSNITASFGLNVYATGGSNVTSSLYIKNKYSGQQRACAVFEGTVSSNYIAIGRAIYTGIEVMLDVHGQSQLQGNCYFGVDKSNKAYFYGQIYCKDLSDSYMYNLPRYNNILGPSQPNDFGTLGISKSTGRIALIG